MLPGSPTDLHYTALRFLNSGTRLDDALLLAPKSMAPEVRMRLADKSGALEQRYLKKSVSSGQQILPSDVLPWPRLGQDIVVAIELPGPPDLMTMNAGTTVEVLVDDANKLAGVHVLAVVRTGQSGWLALLAKCDEKLESLVSAKDRPVLRIMALPQAEPWEGCPVPETPSSKAMRD